jgi:hypothetical protein
MTTAERERNKKMISSERDELDRVRARNKQADVRASRSASALNRASKRSERVVDAATRRLRSAGVIK